MIPQNILDRINKINDNLTDLASYNMIHEFDRHICKKHYSQDEINEASDCWAANEMFWGPNNVFVLSYYPNLQTLTISPQGEDETALEPNNYPEDYDYQTDDPELLNTVNEATYSLWLRIKQL
jgi:hypothetical protein